AGAVAGGIVCAVHVDVTRVVDAGARPRVTRAVFPVNVRAVQGARTLHADAQVVALGLAGDGRAVLLSRAAHHAGVRRGVAAHSGGALGVIETFDAPAALVAVFLRARAVGVVLAGLDAAVRRDARSLALIARGSRLTLVVAGVAAAAAHEGGHQQDEG